MPFATRSSIAGLAVALSLALTALTLPATGVEQAAAVKARYDKREVVIPMRDGVKLLRLSTARATHHSATRSC